MTECDFKERFGQEDICKVKYDWKDNRCIEGNCPLSVRNIIREENRDRLKNWRARRWRNL